MLKVSACDFDIARVQSVAALAGGLL